MFFGQLMLQVAAAPPCDSSVNAHAQGYVQDPQLAFCGTGDTLTPDNKSAYKPVQVTEFASGSAIDDELKKISVASGNGVQLDVSAGSYNLD